MSENKLVAEVKEISEKPSNTVVYKTSKLGFLFSLLSFVGVVVIVYYGAVGPYSILKQQQIITKQQEQINNIIRVNKSLVYRISQIETGQKQLNIKLSSLNPSQNGLILTQLTSLINGANQSIVVYHDYAGAVQLLKSAQQLLATTNDVIFNNLKIALTSDFDNLLSQSNSDYSIIQNQFAVLSDTITNLKFNQPYQYQASNTENSAWQKFINNIKQSIVGLIKIKEVNPEFRDQLNTPDDSNLLIQRLKISILNLQQAYMTRNQKDWEYNLSQIRFIVTHYYLQDASTQKVFTILDQLQKINFSNNNITIDNTIAALSKATQLYNGK